MAKHSRMQPSSSRENQPPPSKQLDFKMDDNGFKRLGIGFCPLNAAADMQKCVYLFQDWTMKRNVRQGSQ